MARAGSLHAPKPWANDIEARVRHNRVGLAGLSPTWRIDEFRLPYVK